MFERFASEFKQSPPATAPGKPWTEPYLMTVRGYAEFGRRFAGYTFDNGLYRVVDAELGLKLTRAVTEAFPEFAARARPFSYDWLGRQFAVDRGRIEAGQPLLLMLEPGTGEALEIPFTFASFHEQLGDLREPALAQGFFAEWARSAPDSLPLSVSDCVGYRVPLFLGGDDTMGNLEVIDLEVYWSLCAQLRQGTLELPTGTSIRDVSMGT